MIIIQVSFEMWHKHRPQQQIRV